MSERRRDPRTDTTFSLRNLLRFRLPPGPGAVAVVSTAEGFLVAGSREDRPAERAAAAASAALLAAGPGATILRWEDPSGPAAGQVIAHGSRRLVLAVVGAPDGAGWLATAAPRVAAILDEHRLRAAA